MMRLEGAEYTPVRAPMPIRFQEHLNSVINAQSGKLYL